MAKRKKQPIKIKADRNVEEQDIIKYTEMCTYVMGQYSIGHRAFPDFRDGFKPVERRIIWAMHKVLGQKRELNKSARYVGDVIGKYHPHGDSAVYGTMVQMARHNSQRYLIGSGNWGNVAEPKSFAAMRYTEATLSDFTRSTFLNSEYLDITKMLPNFDGKTVEPFLLPAMLPNILLNGAYGIATGLTTNIPSYEPEGLIKLVKKALSGKKVTVMDCVKNLVFNTPYGGYAYQDTDDEDVLQELKDFYKDGIGKFYFCADYELDEDNREIIVNGFVPMVGHAKAVANCEDDDRVDYCTDDSDIEENSDFVQYRIKLKNNVSKAAFEDVADEIVGYFERDITFRMNVTSRRVEIDEDGNEDVHYDVETMPVPDLINKWVEWRIEIETLRLQALVDVASTKMERLNLQLLACRNLDIIMEALKKDNTEDIIAKKLKITREQADYIVGFRLSQLKSLERKKLEQQIKDKKAEVKQLKALLKTPAKSVDTQLKELAKVFK
ncbi:DNA topoisomerase IV subunit A [Vibrio phage vB_VcorM_GR11A]|nr:DNA topoisomerase IV subunit A [Vibrio phage vB_VcorM_GR11A]